jgi:predicted sugar kinase
VRALGVRGVGQSSWGPTVFAICPDPDTAEKVAASLKQRFLNLEAVTCTAARNTGAEVLDRL